MFHHGTTAIKVNNLHPHILRYGDPVSTRGTESKEVRHLIYEMPASHIWTRPRFNTGLALVEGLNLINGRTDLDALRAVAPKTTARFYETNAMSWYAERCGIQMPEVLRRLQHDRGTRKAILYIGAGGDAPEDTRCTSTIQFMIRDHWLRCCVSMRSWDMWLGFPYDTAMFSTIAQAVAAVTDCHQAHLSVVAASAHVYLPAKEAEWDAQAWRPMRWPLAWKTEDYWKRWQVLQWEAQQRLKAYYQ